MSRLTQHLALLNQDAANGSLKGIQRGLEKESLRIDHQGRLAKTDHLAGLGSALTHPHITTDYSEALLEFITHPLPEVPQLLDQLDQVHRFTHAELAKAGELIWPASMPCVLGQDADIPVARYGTSNSGMMKTVYRLGLGHRYGRAMQTIAGIHYNFSLPDSFWQQLQAAEGDTHPLQDYKTQRYFDLIRNFRRYFWLLIYLFGASPALCASFVQGREHQLQTLGNGKTLYMPYATSLRMGDLGYQSDAQQSLIVNYNDLRGYLKTLCNAITQPHPAYEAIGVKDARGNYQQLNTGLLQIENEFYSSIRPKRTTRRGETALQALRLRGVEYIEVRCLDLNPYEPLGINAEQIYFLDAFLLFCLLSDSPQTDDREYLASQKNQRRIVYRGRDPEVALLRNGEEVPMKTWAGDLMQGIARCADTLDQAWGSDNHRRSLLALQARLDNPSLTPSAQLLADMNTQGIGFFQHTLQLAERQVDHFAQHPLSAEQQAHFEALAHASREQQGTLEAGDSVEFEQYLTDYYQQYQRCGCV